jgi:hypothetical protein
MRREARRWGGRTVASTVALAGAVDKAAFARLVAIHHADMARVAYVVCADRGVAEDAVQSAWLVAWRKLRSLRDPDRVRPWLLSVTANDLENAPTEVQPAELARQFAVAYPLRRTGFGAWRSGLPRAFVWILLGAGLLAAIAGAALVGSRLLETRSPLVRNDVPLVPTGIGILTPDRGTYEWVVADGNGALWGRNADASCATTRRSGPAGGGPPATMQREERNTSPRRERAASGSPARTSCAGSTAPSSAR